MFERNVEQLFPVLDELGVGFVAYSSLGRGFITGTATPAGERDVADMRNVGPRRQPGNVEKNVQAVGKLGDLAATKGITVSQLARQRRRCPSDQGRRPRHDRRDSAHGGFGARYSEDHAPVWI
nr:aldo/keto reductase [Streptomyces sp. cf386]